MKNPLDVQMENSDIGPVSIRDYFKTLLKTLWRKAEGFSGKRPLGNSSWQFDVYTTLIKEGFVEGTLDDDGYVDDIDQKAADKFVQEQIINKLN